MEEEEDKLSEARVRVKEEKERLVKKAKSTISAGESVLLLRHVCIITYITVNHSF